VGARTMKEGGRGMSNLRVRARLLLLAAALLLIPAWSTPLWSIRIVAPQYNDGLGMYIGVRDIVGHTEHDIQNINILNHYIGMKPIVPAEVSPLEVMPYVLLFLMGSAAVVALIGRRWAIGAWLGCFTVIGLAGFYEFWSWNYDYGHNLSPDAPIKVPGMTYTPPLIGAKTLLTIRATSYPSWGTAFLLLSFLSGLAAFVTLGRRSLAGPVLATVRGAYQRSFGRAAVLLVAVLGVTACSTGERATAGDPATVAAFAPGQPPCDYCDGSIPELRFGGEIVAKDGSTYRFMSVECMAGFIAAGHVAEGDIRSMRVVDYSHGEKLIDARTAHYVRSELRESPSGLNLLAAETEKVAHNLHFFFHGTRMSWPDVVELVRKEWAL
jgi:copper chaperone NosL